MKHMHFNPGDLLSLFVPWSRGTEKYWTLLIVSSFDEVLTIVKAEPYYTGGPSRFVTD